MNELLLLLLGVAVGARFDTEVKNVAPMLKRPEEKEKPASLAAPSSGGSNGY